MTTPANTRPYRLPSAPGGEMTLTTATRRLTFRQVGYHGQTGAFYALDERPSLTERGGWGPLWVPAWNDPAPPAPRLPLRERARAALKVLLGTDAA